ncbi:DUF3667 domain-containing protein [Mesonia maritima]|uniref:Flagellar biosynthesis protein FlhB n=1 Tax=Mesonia maritima TaxID=1793873 RepID=A0ABU1K501_9FLAO|nr:DUF3667 domain-containing protein [Mesonia maritima]MDR6300695.1 flagellar biosynthesis protein FlhB [Mesonia maritima]
MNCKNCEKQLLEADNYCTNCGAKVIHYRLTLKNVGEEFAHTFLNVDNTILKTFLQMFLNPHLVILDYISGVRKKYLNVISYFTIALTLAGLQLFILRKFYPEALAMPESYQSVNPIIDLNWLFDYYSMLMLVYLPIYALMAKLTFIKYKKFNYTEHLVTMTYLMAHFTIVSVLIILPISILGGNYMEVGMFLNLLLFIHTCYTYKKMYPLSVKQLLFSVFLFFVFATVIFIILEIFFVAYLFLTGDLQELIEASRASQGL